VLKVIGKITPFDIRPLVVITGQAVHKVFHSQNVGPLLLALLGLRSVIMMRVCLWQAGGLLDRRVAGVCAAVCRVVLLLLRIWVRPGR